MFYYLWNQTIWPKQFFKSFASGFEPSISYFPLIYSLNYSFSLVFKALSSTFHQIVQIDLPLKPNRKIY